MYIHYIKKRTLTKDFGRLDLFCIVYNYDISGKYLSISILNRTLTLGLKNA